MRMGEPYVELRGAFSRESDVGVSVIGGQIALASALAGVDAAACRLVVFHVTMGSSYDFRCADLRRMVVNAAYWCLGMEAVIDEKSCVDLVGPYDPPDSGFAYDRLGIKPQKPADFK